MAEHTAPSQKGLGKNQKKQESKTMSEENQKKKRGFATWDPAQHKAASKRGGISAHARGTAHEFTTDEAKVAGRKGGLKASSNRPGVDER
jgi:general stress protein YciG